MNSLMKKQKSQRSRLKKTIKLWEGCKYHFSALTTILKALCSYGNSFTSSMRLPRTAFLTLSLPPPLRQELQMSFLSFFPSCCSPGFPRSHCTLASLPPSRRQELCKCPSSHAIPFPLLHPSFLFLFFRREEKLLTLTCSVKHYSTRRALFWAKIEGTFGLPII